ncbi:head maturation protease, ClpP-related [Vagococcus lutrae]|uniref:head maturation protease, ClpP-related n=1 Tax=Vagococcus lutrae TaxID=81947 RepID=UPI0028911A7A|nr:head maturation protease, ClpP-related [Vagococcus lutrae]MDT2844667.1 Clp protease ClpP [Vagococcus lutrae]
MTTIEIKGPIIPSDYQEVYDYWGLEATSPSKVMKKLSEVDTTEDINVVINSTGGDVWSGSEIYTSLKEHQGHVTVKIVGIAASAASFIACAGDTVKMSPTGQFMIHNAAFINQGDHQAMSKGAEVLQVTDESIRNAYKLKTHLDDEQLIEMMDKETWLNARQAKECGFVDEVMFDDNLSLVATSGNMLSADVIENMRQKMKADKETPEVRLSEEQVQEIVNETIKQLNKQEEKPRMEQTSPLSKFLF